MKCYNFPHLLSKLMAHNRAIIFKSLFQNLAAEKTYSNLDISLKQANEHRNEWFEGVHSCKQGDTLFDVMEKIVKAEVLIRLNLVVHSYTKATHKLEISFVEWGKTAFDAFVKMRKKYD